MMGSAAIQGDLWGAQSRNWAELQERTLLPMYDTVFDALGARAGTRVLDVGCGAGLAAHRAGARGGALVSGLDASAALIAIARERVPSGDFRVGDMETLPFADGAFDVVTGFNAFQYASAPSVALREASRVVRSGGHIAVIVWGAPEQCEASLTLRAVAALLPTAAPGGPGPFALSAPWVLEELLRETGLVPKMSGEVACPFEYADIESACAAVLSHGPVTEAVHQAGEANVRGAILESLRPFRRDDGSYLQQNIFRYVVGTKP